MHRVLKVGRSATHPDRYFIERLDGRVWRMVCGEDHLPLCYDDPKQAIFMANAAGLGIMAEVLQIVQDRGEVDDEALLALSEKEVTEFYEWFVGKAVDQVEDQLLEVDDELA